MGELVSQEVVIEGVKRWEFLVFVFIASIGILQLVAVRTQLKGLLFFKRPILAYSLSLLAIGGSYYWFFQRDNRMDTVMRSTGLEGSGMFYNFCLAAFLALVFTLLFSSLISAIRRKAQINCNEHSQGLDALREKSYFEALKCSFRVKGRLTGSNRRENTPVDQ